MGICFSFDDDISRKNQPPAKQAAVVVQSIPYTPPVKPSAPPLQYPPQQYTYATMPQPPTAMPYGYQQQQQYQTPAWATPVYQYNQYTGTGMQQRYVVQQPMYPPQQQGMSTGMAVAAGVLGGMAVSNLMDAVIEDPL